MNILIITTVVFLIILIYYVNSKPITKPVTKLIVWRSQKPKEGRFSFISKYPHIDFDDIVRVDLSIMNNCEVFPYLHVKTNVIYWHNKFSNEWSLKGC